MNTILHFPICLRPWTGFELDDENSHFGHVRPCCWALQYVGDTNTTRMLDIWNGEEFLQFRQSMIKGETDGLCPPYCPNLMPSSHERSVYLRALIRRPSRNHLLNLGEILCGSTLLRSRPLYTKVTPCLSCNLRCIMCYQSHESKFYLSESIVSDLLEIASHAQTLQVQGGEIFSSRKGLNFLKRLTLLHRPPLLGLITNGTFPTPSGWDLLQQLQLRWITISLDAACRKTYESIRIGGNWNDVIKNIRRLLEIQRKQKPKFEVFLSFTVMTSNYFEIPAFLRMAHNLGVDVIINPLTPDPDTAHLDVLNDALLRYKLRAILRDALSSYANRYRMPMARSTLKVMHELTTNIVPYPSNTDERGFHNEA